MIKRFFRDGLIYSVGNILTKGLFVLLIPFYTRVLSPADFGVIDMVTILLHLANLSVALEINQGLARYYGSCDDTRDRVAIASSSFWFTVAMFTLFAIALLVFAEPFSSWLLGPRNSPLLFYCVIAAAWFSGVFLLLHSQLRWGTRAKEAALSSFGNSFSMIIVTLVGVLFLQQGVLGVVVGLIAGPLIGCGIAFWFIWGDIRGVFDLGKLRLMLRFSIPLVPASICSFTSLYIGRILIREHLSFDELGLYSIAVRMAGLVGILLTGFQSALTPLIYKNYQEPDTPSELARLFRYYCCVALCVFLTLSTMAEEVILVFATRDYLAASTVAPLLLASVFLAGMYDFSPGLGIAKKTKLSAALSISAALLNVVLSYVLILNYGIAGAASAAVISSFMFMTAYFCLAQRYYRVPYEWSKLTKGTLVTLLMIAVQGYFPAAYPITVPVKIVTVVLGIYCIGRLMLTFQETSKIWSYFR